MILQIDAGNTRIKWRLRQQFRNLSTGVVLTCDGWSWLRSLNLTKVKAVYVSSVLDEQLNLGLISACRALGYPDPLFAQSQPSTRVGDGDILVNGYDNPELLGVDRWLVLLAARQATKKYCVVVDAGSAMTVDVIADSGRHIGGYVAPGLQMMRSSLAQGAAGLAGLDELVGSVAVDHVGTNTQDGVSAALLNMGCGLICAAKRQAPGGLLYVTGGDAAVWSRVFTDAVSMASMVMDGLECYFE